MTRKEEIIRLLGEAAVLAKLEFGERQTEFIGYEWGDNYDGFYSDVCSLEEAAEACCIEDEPEEIQIVSNLKEDEFYTIRNFYVIRPAFRKLNAGWEKELFNLLRRIEVTT
jgi:hypothetical protein